MKIIGLTGGSGTGKGTVAARMRSLGAGWVDADAVYRGLCAENREMLDALDAAFGGVTDENGALDRPKLAKIVFSDPEKLKLLNRTVFPFITREIEAQVDAAESAGQKLLLLDAPTLYEAGADRLCRFVVAVCAPFELRLKRIVERDGLSREAALLRLSAQNGDAYYGEKADLVLYNDGTKEEFLQKADELIEMLIRRFMLPEIK